MIKSRADYIIGIDPDAAKSGVALLDRATVKLTLKTLSFPDLLDYLKGISDRARMIEHKTVYVVIEAGWMNDTVNYHGYHFDRRGEKIARDVGRNHETGRKIAEMCRHWAIECVETPPLPLKIGGFHLWKGKDGKISHEEFVSLTAYDKKVSNQEERDAGLLAWNCAGLPMRILKRKQ